MLTNLKRVSESNLIKELNRSLIEILYRQSGYIKVVTGIAGTYIYPFYIYVSI